MALAKIEGSIRTTAGGACDRPRPAAGSSACRARTGAGARSTPTTDRLHLQQHPVRRPRRAPRPVHGGPDRRAASSCWARSGYRATTRRPSGRLGFLRRTQRPTGAWYGRWGVNYIYGTWSVLRGLEAIGADPRRRVMVGACVRWLEARQNPDGGWGETCASYDDARAAGTRASRCRARRRGRCSACSPPGQAATPVVERGIEYLLRAPASRRRLGGPALERHRLPAGLLPEVPPLRPVLPALGARVWRRLTR